MRIVKDLERQDIAADALWESALRSARICYEDLSRTSRRITVKVILKVLKIVMDKKPGIKLKYEDERAFLKKYPKFKQRDSMEQTLLWQTANSMNILFCEKMGIIRKAASNKGVALEAISKFLGMMTMKLYVFIFRFVPYSKHLIL